MDDPGNDDTFVRYRKTGWTSAQDDMFLEYFNGYDVTIFINLDDNNGFGGGGVWAG